MRRKEPQPIRASVLASANRASREPWEPLLATVFLEYARDGNRSRFEALHFARRQRLATLVLAEVLENRGRHLDRIADGIWALCEESFWGVPAHLGAQKRRTGLPDVSEPTIDLFAAETASLLAWSVYLLGDRLDRVSPLLRERVHLEAERRILAPGLDRNGDFWLPDIQVAGARSHPGSAKGLYVAAKGGHNAESHNHNDVGNFIVYANGKPVLIDVGVETYAAKTFSSRRYEIWTMQSAYHNLPTVNGILQRNGRGYRATNVEFRAEPERVSFALDIAGAYPVEARLKSWKRRLELRRGQWVELTDAYALSECVEPPRLNLMTPMHVDARAAGRIALSDPSGGGAFVIDYDAAKLNATVEEIPISDGRLMAAWGTRVARIVLACKSRALQDGYRLRLRSK